MFPPCKKLSSGRQRDGNGMMKGDDSHKRTPIGGQNEFFY
ncbi:hypothetical protein HMPREF9124_0647 [Oribacterium sp. oral taxon 108 str. F0425]|nr:hypothetical protein HMPREF9124_0647 [Oribacterium sp. oral taxon 108 str. F0425]